VVHPGAVLHLTVTALRPVAPIRSGAMVGLVTVALNADTTVTWRVVSSGAIAGPSLWWRLFSA